MSLRKKTVKELQQMCRDANLSISGEKKDLVERLEFRSANNTMNQDLMQRVRELENTIMRLEMRSADKSVENGDQRTLSEPQAGGFKPNLISSPRPASTIAMTEAHIPQEDELPVVTGNVQVPNYLEIGSVSQYTHTVSAPQYSYANATQQTRAPNVPQYTNGNVPQYAPVSILQYASASIPQYVLGNVPQQVYAAGVPHYEQGPSIQHMRSNIPVPTYVQPSAMVAPLVPNVAATMSEKNIIMVLPDFNPTAENSLSSKQFVQRVQMLKNVYQWRDDIVVFAVQQKLRGHAKYWMDAHAEVFLTWQQLANKLVETFPFNDNAADAHINMANTKRGPNETPQEYYYRMLALGTKYGMTNSAIARHIINVINDADLKRKISNEYASCVELLQDINSYCRYNHVGSPYHKNKDIPYSQVVQKRDGGKQGHERQVYTKPSYKTTEKQPIKHIRCYNCSQYGHISANCTEPQRIPRCERCNKHHKPEAGCTPSKPTTNVRKVSEDQIQKPELIKCVEINGWSGQALVDSGSDKTLIRKSLMSTLGAAEKCHITLNGFGGGQYLCTQCIKVTMLIDGIAHEVNALAVEDECLDTEVLLGRDTLCQQGIRVVIENEKCWVENVKAATSCVPELELHEREKLMTLLAEHRACFAENVQELGTCSVKKMVITLTTDIPVHVKPYRIPFAKREEARNIIEELLHANIIEHSDSPYASPVVLVPKQNGSLRLCVDYRLLNRITIKIPFPMPIMDEQFAQLAGNRYFTTMDLRMGYHQVEIEEESRKYTGFITVDGHYQYTRMPFGLVNAPAVFQDIMNIFAAKLPPGEVLTYLDDVGIPSKTSEEGLERLQNFLRILREAGLTLRLDKCKFLATEIAYLGHTITGEGITPGNSKVSAIQNFRTPTSVTEVRRFLGLTGFFRKFIPNYAVIATPLTKMLHKAEAQNFNWGEEQDGSFRKLIQLLCEKPILALYDYRAHHEVHTDASSVGLAGVLLQSEDMKNWHAVFYYSRHCTETERRYHSYELEVLAAVETLTRFRVYLLGKPFRLVTDCSAIARAKAQKELIPKIARWYMKLNEFDFEAVHRPGTRLAHVDALSRAPNEPCCEMKTAGFVHRVFIEEEDWLYTMQMQDERLKHIISVLRGENKDDQESQYRKEYLLKKSRLYRLDNGPKFVVPKAVRWRVVKSCHDDTGHFGVDKTMARIRATFWFPKMRKYVRDYITSCVECCYAKAQGGKIEGQMHFGEVDPRPFSTLHLDHLGPFVKSTRGMTYVFAISDAFTKFLVVKPVRSTKTAPVISALLDITAYFGLPKRVITDRGTAFTSRIFAEFCEKNCIQHIKNAVRILRANGQVERANQIILVSLRTANAKPKDWDLQLRNIQWAVNSQQNATTGYCPNELVFDFRLRDLTHNKMIAVLHDENMENADQPSMKEKRRQAAENITQEREKWKQRFDRRHAIPTIYDVDDLVLVAHEPPATGESRKLEPKYKGPYIIAKSLGNDRYLVRDVPGMQITQKKPFESVFAAEKLKKWCSSAPELDGEGDSDTDDEESFHDEKDSDVYLSLEDEPESGRAEL